MKRVIGVVVTLNIIVISCSFMEKDKKKKREKPVPTTCEERGDCPQPPKPPKKSDEKVTCKANEKVENNKCVAIVPTCAADEVLDQKANKCIKRVNPQPPVVVTCKEDEILDPVTKTCKKKPTPPPVVVDKPLDMNVFNADRSKIRNTVIGEEVTKFIDTNLNGLWTKPETTLQTGEKCQLFVNLDYKELTYLSVVVCDTAPGKRNQVEMGLLSNATSFSSSQAVNDSETVNQKNYRFALTPYMASCHSDTVRGAQSGDFRVPLNEITPKNLGGQFNSSSSSVDVTSVGGTLNLGRPTAFGENFDYCRDILADRRVADDAKIKVACKIIKTDLIEIHKLENTVCLTGSKLAKGSVNYIKSSN